MPRGKRDEDPPPLQAEEEEEEKASESEGSHSEDEEFIWSESSVDEMDYLGEFLDGAAPLAVGRSGSELRTGRVITRKQDRAELPMKSRNFLRESATEGIETKFEIMDSVNLDSGEAVAILSKAYKVDLRVAELRSVIDKYDMGDVFDIPIGFVARDGFSVEIPAPGSEKVNLFKHSHQVDLDTIKKACEFFATYGPSYMVENLTWSGELILNCCSPDLRTRIETQIQSVPMDKEVAYKSGPVYFKMMMEFVVVRDSSTLRGLINQFERLSVKDFPGENVRDYNTVAHGVYNMLSNATNLTGNIVIPDMVKIIKRGLIASSTAEFNSDLTAEVVLLGRNCTVEALTDKANDLYSGLLGSSLWAAGDGKQADTGFFAGKCYECNEVGHKREDCPLLKNKDGGHGGNNDRNGGRGRGGGGRGTGRGGRGGRGGRQGRGGRGGGRNGDRSSNDSSNNGKDPFRIPPKKGEGHTKTIDGKTYRWCGRCSRWGDHTTDQHKAMLAMTANENNNEKASDDNKDKPDEKNDSGNYVGRLTPRF